MNDEMSLRPRPGETVEDTVARVTQAAKRKKRGRVVLAAWVDVEEAHDVETHLRGIEQTFANRFSIAVHELYPDATIDTQVTIERAPREQ